MSYNLMSYVWAQIAGTSSFVADIRRNIHFYWHSQLEGEMAHCDTPEVLPHLVTRSETVQQALSDAQTLRHVAYALWATRYKSEPPVPASVIEDETRYLHFNFTYLVVSGIFVKHNNKRLQLSYTLGTVQGSPGLVLATRILPTEKWDYMRLVFDDTFKQCTQPPVMIWTTIGKSGIASSLDCAQRFSGRAMALVLAKIGGISRRSCWPTSTDKILVISIRGGGGC